MPPTVSADALAWITEADMVEVDRIMIDDLGITLLQMMENAGRNLARLVLDAFSPTSVWVAAGSGGNGGGGLVAARHLLNAGLEVSVTTTRGPDEMSPAAAHQFRILERMDAAFDDAPPRDALALDALIGYSLRGAPGGRSADLIQRINGCGTVVSLDVPSGLDATDGSAPGAVVGASATLTLALPKAGLRASAQVGDLYVADISVPRSVAERFGPSPDFLVSPILRVV